jgi:hypothetical protein
VLDTYNVNKATISAVRRALYDFDRGRLTSVVKEVFGPLGVDVFRRMEEITDDEQIA